jgi:arabinogalactan oligomer/maltooligosaccharide transport system permease protein
VFAEKPVLVWFKNTLILAGCTVILSLSLAIPAAYRFSRRNFAGKRSILNILILLNAFPAILSMLALYKLTSAIGLMNTRTGLIIIYTGTMAIFGVWNMKGYFDSIPEDIENSARIDGASEFQVVSRIVMPLAKPAIIVTSVMVLIFVWNEYIYSITFLTGAEHYTLAAGLYSLQAGEFSGSWPVFAASSLIISLPVLIIFMSLQKHMVSGLSAGGVKG